MRRETKDRIIHKLANDYYPLYIIGVIVVCSGLSISLLALFNYVRG